MLCPIQSTQADMSHEPLRILLLEKVMPYPPATAGDAVYSRGIIEALSHVTELTVLCADSGSTHTMSPSIELHQTGPQRKGQKGSVFSRWPLIAWKGAKRDYHAQLDVLLTREWDAIVLDNLGTAHALPKVEAYRRRHRRCRVVHFSHEHEYEARRKKYGAYEMGFIGRIATRLDLFKVKRTEEKLVRRCDLVTVLNEADKHLYRSIAPNQSFLMLTPGYDGRMAPARTLTAQTPRRVLLFGGRRPAQKQQVLLDWLKVGYPILSNAGIETQVIGDIPDPLCKRLAQAYPDLDVRGFVDNPEALIADARAGLIVDTLGGGFKLRLLSHVFERLPIIGLADAIEGLPVSQGEGYLAAENHEALAQLVVATIDDIDGLQALADTALNDCEGKFSWASRARDLVAALGGAPVVAATDGQQGNRAEEAAQ